MADCPAVNSPSFRSRFLSRFMKPQKIGGSGFVVFSRSHHKPCALFKRLSLLASNVLSAWVRRPQ